MRPRRRSPQQAQALIEDPLLAAMEMPGNLWRPPARPPVESIVFPRPSRTRLRASSRIAGDEPRHKEGRRRLGPPDEKRSTSLSDSTPSETASREDAKPRRGRREPATTREGASD